MSEKEEWFKKGNLFVSRRASGIWVKQCLALGCSNAKKSHEGPICKILSPFEVNRRFDAIGCSDAKVGGRKSKIQSVLAAKLFG